MSNAWDDFWGGFDGWRKDIVGDGYAKSHAQIAQNKQNLAASNAAQTAKQAAPVAQKNHGMNFNESMLSKMNTPYTGPMARPENLPPQDEYAAIIADLKAKIAAEYKNDGQSDSLVDQAYGGSLAAIGKARDTANSNYKQSDANLASLTQSHVNNIQGADRQAVERVGADLSGSYNQIYDQRNAELEADRTKAMNQRVEMLGRLGIQDAGLGETGQIQSADIASNSAEKSGALRQAAGYQAADLTRNTELASSQAAAGVERRSDLSKQLQGILGDLNNSEAGIQNDMATAKLSGRQADQQTFNQQKNAYADALQGIMGEKRQTIKDDRQYGLDVQKMQNSTAAKGTGSVYDAVGKTIQNMGVDDAPYLDAYSQSMLEGGGALQGDGSDKVSYLQRQMMRKNPKLNPTVALQYASGILSYGTDKLTAR